MTKIGTLAFSVCPLLAVTPYPLQLYFTIKFKGNTIHGIPIILSKEMF